MSQVKLTLRPPPNVDFVHGYPGIPPGPDRPQAAVKGAIEVRVPPTGVKAKWVRVELRKVETLPGGGQANTFYDSVGPSPVDLWHSPDEYGMLRTQDFPFSIRIPESIPPSIALDKLAGINYEIIASVCVKGKKGFLRKAKSSVVTTQAPIIIDKHELHTTWPVYCQPEQRILVQDGLSLIIERTNTCYGPGDRISLWATLKSDSVHPVVLRGFEMQLKESTVFRSGPFGGAGKKGNPQVRVGVAAEAKFAVNATIYGGTMHNAELTCGVSPDQTTTTLNAARHIDVTYKLAVKALMGTGQPLIMELPVVISNWQRHVSQEAIRRIGPAPSLSLIPAPPSTSASHQVTRVDPIKPPAAAATLPSSRTLNPADSTADEFGYAPKPTKTSAYNTAPVNAKQTQPSLISQPSLSIMSNPSSITRVGVEEGLGYGVGAGYAKPPAGAATYNGHQNSASRTSISPSDEFGTLAPGRSVGGSSSTTTGAGRRPNSGRGGGGVNRFTITNAHPEEVSEDGGSVKGPGGAAGAGARAGAGAGAGTGGKVWPTAEEEKARLYESARAKVERTQVPAPATRASPPPTQAPPAAQQAAVPRGAPPPGPWPTTEEEKTRLFNQAQAAAMQKGAYAPPVGYDTPPPAMHGRSNSAGGSKPSAGAALYQEAMKNRNQPAAAPKGVPYLTAEQEKAALRRYHEAKNAVSRTQGIDEPGYDAPPPSGSGSGGPVAYEALYPSAAPGGSSSHQPPPPSHNDLPPPFEATSGIPQAHLSEKERMRRAYEAQDAAAVLARNTSVASTVQPTPQQAQDAYSSPPPFSTAAPANNGAAASPFSSAIAEKEALRKKLEARDAAAAAAAATKTPSIAPLAPMRNTSISAPTRNASVTSNRGALPRPIPATPPASAKILTAAEEKALLRARYEAEDRVSASARAPSPPPPRVNGGSAPLTPPPTAYSPPPLMPRPPVEYIQETQEEDARVSQYAINGVVPSLRDEAAASGSSSSGAGLTNGNGRGLGVPGIDMQPFTPFTPGFDAIKVPGPPPPLPPKPAGE